MLCMLRQKFWSLDARALTQHIHRSCIPCSKRHEGVIKELMGDLTKPRLTPHEPLFTYTGVDSFSPFHVKIGRGTKKVYRCNFVCLTCRAIHIEDVGSLESGAFIQDLWRLISIRGAVKEVWSDNGTNFTGGEKEIRDVIQDLDHYIIKKSLHEKDVEWHCQPLTKWYFHPPTASHISGAWELLTRSVHHTMEAILVTLRPSSPGRPSEPSLLRQSECSTNGLYAQAATTPMTGKLLLPVISFNRDKGIFTTRRFPRQGPAFQQAMAKGSNSLKPLLGRMAA